MNARERQKDKHSQREHSDGQEHEDFCRPKKQKKTAFFDVIDVNNMHSTPQLSFAHSTKVERIAKDGSFYQLAAK